MTDPRLRQLAENLIHYSVKLQKGEKILIEVYDCDDEVAEELIRAAYRAGGLVFCQTYRSKVSRAILEGATEEQITMLTKNHSDRMREMDAYISFRGNDNMYENSGVSKEIIKIQTNIYAKQVHHDLRVKKTKWCVLRYPNAAMAQEARMSTREFEDFYFKVCNLDYAKMDKAMDSLAARLNKTDMVRIVGPGTDISFSIKGIPSVKCAGDMNIPDGELFTAPVKDSVNGRITYNTPSYNMGFLFDNVSLLFKDGKIIEATSNDTERINHIFDTDEGARYVGEFAFGVNPYITRCMNDILFDEKITGSIHFTPGACYEEAENGNESSVHWDLVLVQTPEYGGGQIYFDDVLVRNDGRFVVSDLECLNPENLK